MPGHITMDLGEFNGTDLVGPIRLIGNSRDIRLEQFTQSLELENQRGDVELHPGRVPLPSIEARTGSGRIELVLPEKATFILDATAERGEALNEFGSAIHQESDGKSATLKGKVGEGPTLHIISSRGSISVRKEGAEQSEGSGDKAEVVRHRKAGLSPGRQAKACPTWDKLQLVQSSQARLGPRGHEHSLAIAALRPFRATAE